MTPIDDWMTPKPEQPEPGVQRFIPAGEMSEADWQLARLQNDPGGQQSSSLFSSRPKSQDSFPTPQR